METNKKEKVINVGMTDELMTFLNNWTERTLNETKEMTEEKRKIGIEVKLAIAGIAKNEVEKIDKELSELDYNDKDKDMKWFKAIEKLDKISDLVRWF